MGTAGAAALFLVAGCGGGPLDGSWTTSVTTLGTTFQETIDLKDDATASVELEISKAPSGVTCTGSLQFSGYDWASTDTTVTLSGSASCTTSLVCSAGGKDTPFACSPQQDISGTCHYKLTNSNDALELSSCSNKSVGDVTFNRVN